jgi:hypothetical protein
MYLKSLTDSHLLTLCESEKITWFSPKSRDEKNQLPFEEKVVSWQSWEKGDVKN